MLTQGSEENIIDVPCGFILFIYCFAILCVEEEVLESLVTPL